MYMHEQEKIEKIIRDSRIPSHDELEQILKKAELKKGLDLEEVASLLQITDQSQLDLVFKSAGKIKDEIYGNRLVLFAPLYLSDYCVNDCEYCGFQCRNQTLNRKRLTIEEIREETKKIIGMGHKRILLEAGEHPENSIDYVCEAIKTIYETKVGNGEIRRVNINIAATSVDDYKKLKDVGIGTYQLFQETYHQGTYKNLHKGPKADFNRQLIAHEQAFDAGIDDYGIGVLFGLYDYRYEVLSLLDHAEYLDKTYGVGPHTISVPRFQRAPGVVYSAQCPVTDFDFLKLIAVLRLSVPYTGMIISTRESAEIRKKAFTIGISQTSAASKTSPGGYSENGNKQFEISDERNVQEVLESVCKQGLLPSFCTACYRSNRTGDRFMQLAKSGDINYLCRPNAILTFKEFLMDYAEQELKKTGEQVIEKELGKIDNQDRKLETRNRLLRIEEGERDLYF
jgi:2-iminoacetate synthase